MIKELIEKRGALMQQLKTLSAAPESEKRAFTAEEQEQFDKLSDEIAALDKTIDSERRAEALLAVEHSIPEQTAEPETEVRAVNDIISDFIRGNELRAGEMTTTSTGGIIPSEFSDDIIRKTISLSGIMNMISIVNSKGVYKQIVADDDNKITAGWTDEIAEITSSEAKFKTLEIGHHKLTSLVKLSLELINQNDFDIASEVTSQMYEDFAYKAESAIIGGDGKLKPLGLTASGTAYEVSAPAFSCDDIVKIFHSLKAPYHPGAAWLMSNNTLCEIRLLKDGNGQYLFHQNNDLTSGFMGTILGKPVLVSETMDDIEAGKNPILFGDFSRAYKANINPEMTMQVLNEKYAEFACKGVLGILWIDGRPVNPEAYVNVSVSE